MTYDSFDIKFACSLEVMRRLISLVNHHILSYMYNFHRQMMHLQLQHLLLVETNTRPLPDTLGMASTSSGWQFTSDWRRYEMSIQPVPTILEDLKEGSDDEEEDPRFRAYSPPTYMHNVDLSQDNALEFPDIPHRKRDRTSSSLDSGELEVGVLEDHPKMNSDMLTTLILSTVKADPKTSVSVLIANIRSQLRYTPSYRKAWIAKQKALEKILGGCDASYNEVWQWCQVLERYVPSCVTDLETETEYYNDRLLRRCQSTDDWKFFLSRLRRHVCPQPNICVISDRGIGILAAIEQQRSLWHRTYHRYCLRHVASNYYGQFRFTSEKRQVTNMGYEISNDRFHEMLAVLHSVNEKGADYLCNIPFEQWTQAYDDSLRYGHMTSNLAECINSVLKGTRHLPITSVVREINFHLAALFSKRAKSYKGQM
ncbi:hypothetical protein PVK06_009024 [Gossypium arboreum]|uniref:Transposase n=1 Tax=Gossypium arboreum TaxID=29729 RepID=A0ABR0QLF5_GOSAR|nr:hypothetical protein PVK06_009024 [Gossypium arboreum]